MIAPRLRLRDGPQQVDRFLFHRVKCFRCRLDRTHLVIAERLLNHPPSREVNMVVPERQAVNSVSLLLHRRLESSQVDSVSETSGLECSDARSIDLETVLA